MAVNKPQLNRTYIRMKTIETAMTSSRPKLLIILRYIGL